MAITMPREFHVIIEKDEEGFFFPLFPGMSWLRGSRGPG